MNFWRRWRLIWKLRSGFYKAWVEAQYFYALPHSYKTTPVLQKTVDLCDSALECKRLMDELEHGTPEWMKKR